jgi:hypothetical protein
MHLAMTLSTPSARSLDWSPRLSASIRRRTSSRVVGVWALVEWIVLAPQERVVLSAKLEFVSFVRPFTRYGGVHTDRRYFCTESCNRGYRLTLDGKACEPVLRQL